MAKAKVKTEARGTPVNPMTKAAWPAPGAPAPADPVLGLPDVLERLALHERRAAVAREACAGTRVIEAAARDAAGLGWEFHPYAPDSRAERAGRGWEGWFTVGGKRLLVRIDLEEREPNAAEAEALAAAAAAEEAHADVTEDRDAIAKDLKEKEDELEEEQDRRKAWEDTVQEALDGDGPGAVAAAAKIKAEDRP